MRLITHRPCAATLASILSEGPMAIDPPLSLGHHSPYPPGHARGGEEDSDQVLRPDSDHKLHTADELKILERELSNRRAAHEHRT